MKLVVEETFCVYILYSEANDRFYVGHTNSIDRRIDEHNTGKNRPTAPYVPWKVIGVFEKPDKSSAVALEFKYLYFNKIHDIVPKNYEIDIIEIIFDI